MAKISNEDIIKKVLAKMAEKDEIIKEQQLQIQGLQTTIQGLESKLKQAESAADIHEDLLTRLNEVLD